ncbi:MAG: endonuclease/exonuclease/phosphatase family protein [Acidobacteriaceae bacterium]|nr:endonuclease/exonuclease/phosphatase family protein [Acidobacteriaceae bacterium]
MKFVLLTVVLAGGSFLFLSADSQPAVPDAPDFNLTREIEVVPPDPNLQAVRVATWNIERGTELDLISSELASNPADLLLLQEVDLRTVRANEKDVAAELARRLQLNAAFGTEFEELGQEKNGHAAYIGQATLTRLPIRKSRVLRFQRQSGFWKPHSWIPSSIPLMQRRLGSRIALVTELDFQGRLLVVYNAHLESRSAGPIQSAQLDEILADLKQYPPHTAVILGGDLNTKYMPSTFLHKLQKQGFESATGTRVERTHAIAMSLDWIFASGAVRLDEGQVRRNFKGSDHYPVYADLVAR